MSDAMDFTRGFCFAYGGPAISGIFKSKFEDFIVEEELGYELSGEGEHLYLYIEKKDQNTGFIQQRLAQYYAVPMKSVSYCGLKDRQAVTRQWFSVHLPGKKNDEVEGFNDELTTVLKHHRHNRKLRLGAHKHNRFIIVLRDIQGDRERAEQQLHRIAKDGVPNYFGSQRFGRDRGNLALACDLFAGRHLKKRLRSIAISSARSYVFNCVLDERIKRHNWDQWLDGDVVSLSGCNSFFVPPTMDAQLAQRLTEHDVHLTAPLWGRGELPSKGEPAAIESQVGQEFAGLTQGLETIGLDQQRRAMRMSVADLAWQFEDDCLSLSFNLASGCFATALLREVIKADKPL